jgi:beta-phosphoglucomutase-like phosphatase (HAD superfamily)
MIGRSHPLRGHCYEATRLRQVLKRRGISDDEETRHRHQPMQLEEHIKTLLDEQINLEADIKLKKASLQKAKKELKSVREKKKKIDMPLFYPNRKPVKGVQHFCCSSSQWEIEWC